MVLTWLLEPRLQALLGLLQVAAGVEPAELLPAIVIGLAGQVVECVAETRLAPPLLQVIDPRPSARYK